jgi:hypothetical protein
MANRVYQRILLKVNICLVYKELITLRVGTTTIASGVIIRESYLRLRYT